ncbi:hypothetical protein GCM10023081_28200 [Arthrobacter ginkgonis]|uniref:Uncharacterized protein n=1 Tax=Arthrobacter ginkgonis TaxID=1630594 RepID=A0ABP7CJZ6_9MICC
MKGHCARPGPRQGRAPVYGKGRSRGIAPGMEHRGRPGGLQERTAVRTRRKLGGVQARARGDGMCGGRCRQRVRGIRGCDSREIYMLDRFLTYHPLNVTGSSYSFPNVKNPLTGEGPSPFPVRKRDCTRLFGARGVGWAGCP